MGSIRFVKHGGRLLIRRSTIELEQHCDDRDALRTKGLSLARLGAAAKEANGVPARRKPFGEKRPLARTASKLLLFRDVPVSGHVCYHWNIMEQRQPLQLLSYCSDRFVWNRHR